MNEVEERLIVLGTILIISAGVLTNLFVKEKEARAAMAIEPKGSWSCMADTFQCPDGHTVTRVGPYCHFEACN